MANYWKIVNRLIREADIILEVLDARLVDETRNVELEKKIDLAGKKVIYVINKADLVDKSFLDKKKKEIKNCVFVSSVKHYGSKILRERILMLADNDLVTVGVVGYPNTGKSSVINMLKGKGAAPVSSTSGFTKGVQKIRVTRRIMMIDSPGVIPFKRNDETKLALIGSLNAAKLKFPDIDAMALIENLDGAVEKHYGIEPGEDSEESLERIAVKKNKLLKGGKPDVLLAARMMIQDWQKGKIKIMQDSCTDAD